MAERLPSECEAPSSNTSTDQKKPQKEKKQDLDRHFCSEDVQMAASTRKDTPHRAHATPSGLRGKTDRQ